MVGGRSKAYEAAMLNSPSPVMADDQPPADVACASAAPRAETADSRTSIAAEPR